MKHCWQILKPGFHSSFQDTGRFSWAHLGIPVSGALDIPAAQWANRLLGNAENSTVIEITLTGLSFKSFCDCSIAVTGAVFECHVNGKAADNQQTINLKAGDTFNMVKLQTGLRAHMAVAGGFEIETILGSTSTLVMAQLGGYKGRALQTNDFIKLNDPKQVPVRPVANWKRPKSQNTHIIRALPGPEYDLFDHYSQKSVWQQAFLPQRLAQKV